MTEKPTLFKVYIYKQTGRTHMLPPNDQYSATEFNDIDVAKKFLSEQRKMRKLPMVFAVYAKGIDITDSVFSEFFDAKAKTEQLDFTAQIARSFKINKLKETTKTMPEFVADEESASEFKLIRQVEMIGQMVNKK